MAEIVPFARSIEEEKAENLDGMLPEGKLPPSKHTAGEILAKAQSDGSYRIDLSPRHKQLLSQLAEKSDVVRAAEEAGYVSVPIERFRLLPADAPVRIGYQLHFTPAEISLLKL